MINLTTYYINVERIKKKSIDNLMIYFNDYFIRNRIWSSLIHFDPFWTDLIQSDQKMNKVENPMIYFNDYFIRNIRNPIWSSLIRFDPFWSILIHSDPFWTDLVQSDQKIYKVENLMIYFNDYLIRNQMWSSLIKFDPFWTDLIQSDQKKNWRLKIWWYISMIISSEIENVEKVENFEEKITNQRKAF